MRPAFFVSLLLAAVHVSVLVDCRPRPRGPARATDPRPGNSRTESPAGTGRFYLEPSGSMKGGVHRHFLVVLPVRTDRSDFVSIFDLRRKRFLCMDVKGELFISRQRDEGDCLFQRIWSDVENHHDVFYSASGGELLRLRGAQQHRERPERRHVAPRERVPGPSARRQRRSEEVNPSDPLRSHSYPSQAAKDHKDDAADTADASASLGKPEQDQAGAVSKETITSCDDPLMVLRPNGPVSPVKTNIADRAEQD